MNRVIRYLSVAVLASMLVALMETIALWFLFKHVYVLKPDDLWFAIKQSAYLTLPLSLIFFVVIFIISRPVSKLLQASAGDHHFTDEELLEFQGHAVNINYKVALATSVFYLVSTPLTVSYLGTKVESWGIEELYYSFFAGVVTFLLNLPIAVYIGNIVMEPLIRMTYRFSSTLPRASRKGVRLSVRTKLILTISSLILASLLYASLVGYSQSRMILESGKAIEQALIEQGISLEHIKTESGSEARSMSYFESRQGGIIVFYFLMIAAFAVLGLFLATLVANEISRPVRNIVKKTKEITSGDFEQEVYTVGNDELAYLGQVFNDMVKQIKQQVYSVELLKQSISRMIQQLDQSSKSILGISSEQCAGATQQSTAMQQTSSISNEIVATAKQIEERAGQMDEMASSTIKACVEGREKLNNAIKGYEDIRQQVVNISEFLQRLHERYNAMFNMVEMIEDIAEQTELLAFNASLEAAGAGDAGRRFGVVASSTRSLATRAAEATNQIRSMISNIQDSTAQATLMAGEGEYITEEGRSLIDQVFSALEEISDRAMHTSTSMHEITLTTQQQTSASEQMAQSIGEVNQVAGKVLEGANEIEGSISELAKLTDQLRSTVQSKTSNASIG